MNIVVADACPVIFLAKLNRLALIQQVFPGTILLPESVWTELVRASIPADEQRRIGEFLDHCRIESIHTPCPPASALSLADRHVLTLAGRHRHSIILTDDSLVRRIALSQGQAVAGTLGLIVRAVRAKLMTQTEAIQTVEELVTKHRLRIAVDLYQETLRQIHQTDHKSNK